MPDEGISDPGASRGAEGMIHGGDLGDAEAMFGRPAGGWLDLSTGVNPRPYPIAELEPEIWTRLPNARDIGALRDAAVGYYGVRGGANIAVAPGSQSLIQWLARLRGKSRVAVLGPTYSEHRRSWESAGHDVIEVSSLDEVGEDTGVVIVVNPNNPDGARIDPEILLGLAARLAAVGGWLIVDEAFADIDPGLSVGPKAGAPGVIVLRSFGKFFGLAGLRLGFALADEPTTAIISRALGPWAVSGPAVRIGARALDDGAWIGDARARLAVDARALDGLLAGAGIEVAGGCSLFRFVVFDRAPDLFRHLGRAGIYVRRFEGFPSWLRIGLPAPGPDFERLGGALASYSP